MTAVKSRKFEEIINESNMIEIKQVGITTFQAPNTWGRVFVDYVENGEEKFIFKNFIKFEEKNFNGPGSFKVEPAFGYHKEYEITADYMSVLEGEYDNIYLTAPKYKDKYGTPSKILNKLIQDLDNNLFEDVKNRRGLTK